jgi:DNA polymerase-3 subunit alpha
MCNKDFVHLHLHSTYSLKDALSSIDGILAKARDLGMTHIAITDHGNVYNIPSFISKAKDYGVQPIIGVELYYVPDDNYKVKDDYHFLVLAKDDIGVHNIYNLLTISWDKFYYRNRVTKKDLEKYSKGLYVTTGCIASYPNECIINGKPDLAIKELEWMIEVFGKENVLIEIQDHGLQKQKIVNKFWLEANKKYNLMVIGTNDSHYVNKDDAVYHDVLLAIQTGSRIDDPKRLRFDDDAGNINSEFYIKSCEQMLQLPIFKENPSFLKNTKIVAESCVYREINIDRGLRFPKVEVPNVKDKFEYLKKIVHQNAREVYGSDFYKHKDRIEMELNLIKSLGWQDYFLIVYDIVKKARDLGIYVGPGRGSAAGSIVVYLLGITSIDPTRYGLLFERFINPERVSPPDIDIDFEDTRRQEIINYVVQKYGADKVAKILNFVYIQRKNALRDAFRVYNVPLSDVDSFMDIVDSFSDSVENDDDFFDMLINPKTEIYKRLMGFYTKNSKMIEAIRAAKHLNNKIRQASVHASGLVIADDAITKYAPLVNIEQDNIKQIGTDMKGVEKLGLLKVDILGLRTLSVIHDVVDMVKQNGGEIDDLFTMEPNEPDVFKIFQEAKTLGVFQFESDGMRKFLYKMQPDRFEDLIALNALYRPGPMDYVDVYIRRKRGEKYDTYHEDLRKILDETYGIMVYQEQIMQIAQIIAGFSLGKADILRRAIGKKEKDKMEALKSEFIENAVVRGYDRQMVIRLYEDIEKFADYGFNKSHAAAYAYLAYITAYLKSKYPHFYYTALINSYEGSQADVAKVVALAKTERNDLVFARPNIYDSDGKFRVKKDKTIQHGLYYIKRVVREDIDKLLQCRKNIQYNDLQSFLGCVLSQNISIKTLEALFWSGALSNKEYRTMENWNALQAVFESKKAKSSKTLVQQNTLFALDTVATTKIDFDFNYNQDFDYNLIREKEIEYLGFCYGTVNKCNYYFTLSKYQRDNHNCVVGYLSAVEKRVGKNGDYYYVEICSYPHIDNDTFYKKLSFYVFNSSPCFQKAQALMSANLHETIVEIVYTEKSYNNKLYKNVSQINILNEVSLAQILGVEEISCNIEKKSESNIEVAIEVKSLYEEKHDSTEQCISFPVQDISSIRDFVEENKISIDSAGTIDTSVLEAVEYYHTHTLYNNDVSYVEIVYDLLYKHYMSIHELMRLNKYKKINVYVLMNILMDISEYYVKRMRYDVILVVRNRIFEILLYLINAGVPFDKVKGHYEKVVKLFEETNKLIQEAYF